MTATSKDGIIEAIERQRFRNEPQLRLTRTAEHEEDEPLAGRKRKGAGGSKKSGSKKAKALESDRCLRHRPSGVGSRKEGGRN